MTPNLKPLVTLRVKDGVAYASDNNPPVEPNYEYFSNDMALWLQTDYQNSLNTFNNSFVQVQNPELLTEWPFGDKVDKAFHHALYKPVDGTYDLSDKQMVFEVTEISSANGTERENVAICSLPEKKEVGSEQPYFKLGKNDGGKGFLYYKPANGGYSCWMPIDDELYTHLEKALKH